MATTMHEQIKVGTMAIRFLVEGEESGGSVAVFEFDVPAGMHVAAAHSHDGYEETIYGLEGTLTWTVEGTPTDVGPGNVVPSTAVGQMRIRYFGRGLIKDNLSPGWLVRVFNKIF